MMESGYFNNGNFRKYSHFAGRKNFAALKREFPVALV